MSILEKLAEEKIRAAIDRGDLSDLHGQGRPLQLEDDSAVPEELRAGYRLLKNAGYVPAEVQLKKDIRHIEQLLLQVDAAPVKKRLLLKLSLLKSQI